MLRRIIGFALLAVGVVGVILAIVGIMFGTQVVDGIGATAEDSLALVSDTLNTTKATLEQTKATIQQAETGLTNVVTTIKNNVPLDAPERIKTFSATGLRANARYIRLRAKRHDKGKSWLFLDEIVINPMKPGKNKSPSRPLKNGAAVIGASE